VIDAINVINMIKKIKTFQSCDKFSDADLYLADYIYKNINSEINDESKLAVSLTAAILSREASHGHICLPIEMFANKTLFDIINISEDEKNKKDEANEENFQNFTFPEREKLKSDLLKSNAASQNEFTPMILDNDKIYLQRFYKAECDTAKLINSRNKISENINTSSEQLLELLFPNEEDFEQKKAAELCLKQNFTVISGGPGTGKTFTVAKIIYLILCENPRASIYLCAPSGKAAARLNESLKNSFASIEKLCGYNIYNVNEDVRKSFLNLKASTIHRMLGAGKMHRRYTYGENNPIVCDALIADEASMINIIMMKRLLSSISLKSKIVLLGDKDQLSSVEAGSVMADICDDNSGMSENIAILKRSWRFDDQSGIGKLALLIKEGKSDEACEMLYDNTNENLFAFEFDNTMSMKEQLHKYIVQGYKDYISSPNQTKYENFLKFRILSPLRGGQYGVEALNSIAQDILESENLIDTRNDFYENRPVIVNVNDYDSKLFNGDVGICMKTGTHIEILFPDSETKISPVQMPSHTTCYALTVHKSQGSEFEEVLLVLPDKYSELVSRELLYTAITRAKKKVIIAGSKDVLKKSIENSDKRISGLTTKLRTPTS
jgi:exodeoxyribonuclease V alpha subunit